jgi:hypothetical protein
MIGAGDAMRTMADGRVKMAAGRVQNTGMKFVGFGRNKLPGKLFFLLPPD